MPFVVRTSIVLRRFNDSFIPNPIPQPAHATLLFSQTIICTHHLFEGPMTVLNVTNGELDTASLPPWRLGRLYSKGNIISFPCRKDKGYLSTYFWWRWGQNDSLEWPPHTDAAIHQIKAERKGARCVADRRVNTSCLSGGGQFWRPEKKKIENEINLMWIYMYLHTTKQEFYKPNSCKKRGWYSSQQSRAEQS